MDTHLVYFSPTFSTRKVVKLIGANFNIKSENDITLYNKNKKTLNFNEEDFLILGIPVYSGRVPTKAKEYIKEIKGKNTKIALVATFGNRAYDDSLLELKNIVSENGFLVVGAIAVVAEHNVVREFGKGRPDEKDKNFILDFTIKLKEKITTEINYTDLKILGNSNYREYKTIPIKPHANLKCIKCGICSKNCPADAIPKENPNKTLKECCFTCMRCTVICPQKARGFNKLEQFISKLSLKKVCRSYKTPEMFL